MLKAAACLAVAIAVTATLATPVAAGRKPDAELVTELIEVNGRIDMVQRQPQRGSAVTSIGLLEKDAAYARGKEVGWLILADTQRLRASGVTLPLLLKQQNITFIGYRSDEARCRKQVEGGCRMAARLIRFANGCTVFVGLPADAFATEPGRWGRNLPDDGLDEADYAPCTPPAESSLPADWWTRSSARDTLLTPASP